MSHEDNDSPSSAETLSTELEDPSPPISDERSSKAESSSQPQESGKNLSSSYPSTTDLTHDSVGQHSSGGSSMPEGATGGSSLYGSSPVGAARELSHAAMGLDQCSMESGKLVVFQRYFEEPKMIFWTKPEHRRRHYAGLHDNPLLQELHDQPSLFSDINNNEAGPFVQVMDLQQLDEALPNIPVQAPSSTREPLINQAGAVVGYSRSDPPKSIEHSIDSASTVPIEEAYVGSGHFPPIKRELLSDKFETMQVSPDTPEAPPIIPLQGARPRSSSGGSASTNPEVRYRETIASLENLWMRRRTSERGSGTGSRDSDNARESAVDLIPQTSSRRREAPGDNAELSSSLPDILADISKSKSSDDDKDAA